VKAREVLYVSLFSFLAFRHSTAIAGFLTHLDFECGDRQRFSHGMRGGRDDRCEQSTVPDTRWSEFGEDLLLIGARVSENHRSAKWEVISLCRLSLRRETDLVAPLREDPSFFFPPTPL